MGSGQGRQDDPAPEGAAAGAGGPDPAEVTERVRALVEGAPGTVAVVDLADGAVVVWHVQLDPEEGRRLTGAWRVPLDAADAADAADHADDAAAGADAADAADHADDAAAMLRTLLAGCAILVAADDPAAGPAALGPLPGDVAAELAARPVVDPAATAEGVRGVVALIRRAEVVENAGRAADRRARRAALRLPDVADPAPVDVGYAGLPAVRRALGWARGLEELIATWGEIDAQRRRRDWLGGGKEAPALPMPLVMAG